MFSLASAGAEIKRRVLLDISLIRYEQAIGSAPSGAASVHQMVVDSAPVNPDSAKVRKEYTAENYQKAKIVCNREIEIF